MKKRFTLTIGAAIILLAIMTFAGGSVQAQRIITIVLLPAAPDISDTYYANTATDSPTEAESTAEALPTPEGTPSAVIAFLPDPPEPEKLPTELSSDILYQEPPRDCALDNFPQESCSTRPGQVTDADFTLPTNTALVMTGDAIGIYLPNGKELAPRPNKKSGHDLWVVVNNSDKSVKLHMLAPHGSYRGYFSVEIGETWTIDQIAHLRNLHIERFLLPPQPREYTPTPVANGPKGTNVRVAMWDGTKWLFDSGYYWLKEPYWQRAS